MGTLIRRLPILVVPYLVATLGCAQKARLAPKERVNFSQTKSSLSVDTALDQSCVDALNLQPTGQSLVLNQPELLTNAFSLRAVLSRIAESGGGDSPHALMESLLGTYSEHSHVNPESGLVMPVDVRGGEANMDVEASLDGIVPVALFNRIDLASPAGADCGEYRIVFAKASNAVGLPFGRFLAIFEARYPNPTPALGADGCLPIARLWSRMESMSPHEAVRQAERFFFDGVEIDGTLLPPVLTFDHFRAPFGQVRTNNFINGQKWQLREFRTEQSASAQPIFAVSTVKGTPLTELYSDTRVPKPISIGPIMEALRNSFQEDLVNNQLSHLLAPELNGAQNSNQIITGFGAEFAEGVYEYQSDAQGHSDDPRDMAKGQRIIGLIDDALDADMGVTSDHVMNRLGALTCGGCHRYSAGREIAPGVVWPADAGFVHVTEEGHLSPALLDVFLPERKAILESLLCAEEGTASELDPPNGFVSSGDPQPDEDHKDVDDEEAGPNTERGPEGNESRDVEIPGKAFGPKHHSSPVDNALELDRVYVESHRDQPWTYVKFKGKFESIPAIFTLSAKTETEPCIVRVREVSTEGFQVACLRPAGQGGVASGVTVTYLALTKGAHDFGGQRLTVSCRQLDAIQRAGSDVESDWDEMLFTDPFDDTPVVLANLQSDYNEVLTDRAPLSGSDLFLSMVTDAVHSKGVSLALELSETYADAEIHAEEVCVAAFTKGEAVFYPRDAEVTCHVADTRHAAGAIGVDQMRMADLVRSAQGIFSPRGSNASLDGIRAMLDGGIQHPVAGLNDLSSLPLFSATDFVVAAKSSRYEDDGGWVRLQPLNENWSRLVIDEDQVQDDERRHGPEAAGYITCDGPLTSNPEHG